MKVFGYIRVSGAGQVEKDGPVRQEEAIRKFAGENKLEIPEVFGDLGVTGTIEGINRPGFTEMISAAEQLGVEGIIVEKMDRLARELFISEAIIRELRKRNLKLFCVDQGFKDVVSDDSDPGRKALRQILGVFAQYDRDSLVLKMKVARDRKRALNGRCEGDKPFGQKPAERKALELILSLHEQEISLRGIAVMLSSGGVRRRGGTTDWKKMDIYHIIRRHKQEQKKKAKGAFYEPEQRSQKAQEA